MGIIDQIVRIRSLRMAFRRTFNGPNGRPDQDGIAVLNELKRFCYGAKPTLKMGLDGKIDPYASIAAAARQEVYQRIMGMLDLDDEDLAHMELEARRAAYLEEMSNE